MDSRAVGAACGRVTYGGEKAGAASKDILGNTSRAEDFGLEFRLGAAFSAPWLWLLLGVCLQRFVVPPVWGTWRVAGGAHEEPQNDILRWAEVHERTLVVPKAFQHCPPLCSSAEQDRDDVEAISKGKKSLALCFEFLPLCC